MPIAWILKKQIKKNVENVLKREFVAPFIDSVQQDPIISLKLTNALVLLRVSEQLIVEFDKKQDRTRKKIEAVREKTIFLGYLGKVYQSALLVIGATDYLGGMILLRSVFELLIGISTTENGSMNDRISSISFLDRNEKDNLKKLWNELSAWAHPYGKWIKNICPKFYGCGRNHHQVSFTQCLGYSDQILDLMLTIAIDHFKLSHEKYFEKYKQISINSEILTISKLPMFERRLKKD